MKQTTWIKAVVIKEQAAPGLMAVQRFDDGEVIWIPRSTNQRICDPEFGICEFELDAEEQSYPYFKANVWTEPGEVG